MGEETERLRREIDLTREDLTRDVDQLADKTSPSRMVERRVARAKGGIRGLKEKVMGTPHYGRHSATYPSGYQGGYGTTGYAGEASMTGGEQSRLESAKQATTSAASSAADTARESVAQARESVAQVGERAQQVGERAQGMASDTVSGVREQTAGNPLAAGVVAFGIGWLVSSLMPASEAETQAAQRAADVARERGGPVLDQAKQVASDVGQELQGSAAEAAQQVKERAQDAASTVRDEAKSSATTS